MVKFLFFFVGLLIPVVCIPFVHADWDNTNAPRYYSTDLDGSWSTTRSNDIYSGYKGGCVAFLYQAPNKYKLRVYWDGESRTTVSSGYKQLASDNYDVTCAYRTSDSHYKMYYKLRSGDPSTFDTATPPIDIPEHCLNGTKDGDEVGTDCGGSCPSACQPQCADDEVMSSVCADGTCNAQCNKFEDPIAGLCPAGYTYIPAEDGYSATCHKERDADLVPAEYPEGTTAEDYASEPVDDGWEASMSSGTESTTSNTVDNGDGTSTKTTITDKQNTINGKTDTSTITNTEIIDNSTGDVISSTTTIEAQGPAEENDENFSIPPIPIPPETEINTDIEAPEKTDIFAILRNGIDSLPLMQALDGMNITTTETVCTVSAGTWYGKEISFSLCRWEEMLRSLGAIAVVIAHLGAIFIIFRGVK